MAEWTPLQVEAVFVYAATKQCLNSGNMNTKTKLYEHNNWKTLQLS